MRKRYLFLFVFFCIAFMLSIASAGSLKIDKEELNNLPAVHQIKGLKPIKQGTQECGPTCMAMVMNFWGVKTTKDEIWPKVRAYYGPYTNGNDMNNYFRKHGFKTKVMTTTKYTNLKYFIHKGYPLIALTETRRYPGAGHYIVLIGYNEKGFNIIDPDPGKFDFLTYEQFKKLHNIAKGPYSNPSMICGPFWTLIVCPK